jgi:predicted amidohydrolase
LRVALAQVDCILGDTEVNLRKAKEVVAEAPLYEEALITADIDLGDVRRRRGEVPLVREARLALLARELNRLADEGGDL